MTQFTEKSQVMGTNILDSIKEHPVPAAIAGLGLGMLIFGGFLKKSRGVMEPEESQTMSGMGPVGEEISGSARDVKERVLSKAREWKGKASDYARQFGESGTERIRGTGASVRGAIESNPLTAIAVALAVGAALGFSIPEMKKEREIISETIH